MSYIEPYMPIPLNDQDLALLGRLSATYALVENAMLELAATLVHCTVPTVWKILGGNSTRISVDGLTAIAEERLAENPDMHAMVLEACKKLKDDLAPKRNHFIHSWYAISGDHGGYYLIMDSKKAEEFSNSKVANKIKSFNHKSFSELKDLVDDLARLSCKFAYIDAVIRNIPQQEKFKDRIQ